MTLAQAHLFPRQQSISCQKKKFASLLLIFDCELSSSLLSYSFDAVAISL